MLVFFAGEFAKRDFVMQIHYGVIRNNNTSSFEKLGPDTGFDVIGPHNGSVALAKLLDKLNIDVIEAAPVTDEKIDTLVLRTISPLLKNSILSCPVGSSIEEADRAMKSISGAKNPRLLVSLPVSAVQMEYFYHKKPAQMLELISKLTAHCSSICNDVEFAAVDATRADKAYLFETVKAAIESGAKTVTVCDSAAEMMPEDFGEFITEVIGCIKADGVSVGVICDNKNGLAPANAVIAASKGANVIKTDVKGAGIPLETMARLINHPQLKNIPFYLETPNELDGYREEIELLRGLRAE